MKEQTEAPSAPIACGAKSMRLKKVSIDASYFPVAPPVVPVATVE
ncbi:hypothetical protein ORK51_08150 [Stenotrophomonas rhizophila]|nr:MULTISPECIES: hypothetical protein [Stenotrophomonas]MCX2920137.1 hypothetical protein [Stenotrophomonas rhizophila]